MNAAQALLREVLRSDAWYHLTDDVREGIREELERADTTPSTIDPPADRTDTLFPREAYRSWDRVAALSEARAAAQVAGYVDPAVMNDALDPEA